MTKKIGEKAVGRPREFNEEQVLSAVIDVFWSKGYEAASLTDLCQATGLHKGSLYQAFGDKRQLFLTALEHYSEREFNQVMTALSDSATPLQNLRAVIEKILYVSADEKGCLAVNSMAELAPHDEVVKGALQKFGIKRLQALTELIGQAQQAGEIRPELKPDKLAMQAMFSITGALTITKGFLPKDLVLEVLNDLISSWC